MHGLPVHLAAIYGPWLALLDNDDSDVGNQICLILFRVLPTIGYFGASWTVCFLILGTCWTWWISRTFQHIAGNSIALLGAKLSRAGETNASPTREIADSSSVGPLHALGRYRYEALGKDEIRLLRLYAGHPPEIECELVACRLDQLPWFEAISYT